MEDFAQVFGLFPHQKYEKCSYTNIAQVLSAEIGEEAVTDFVRRLAFSVLIGNADMHLKNWSLLYPDDRVPILSPAYDFVSTIAYLPDDQLALGWGGAKHLATITPDQVRRFADTAHLAVGPLWRTIEETIARTVEVWRSLPAKDIVTATMRHTIEKHIEKVATASKE